MLDNLNELVKESAQDAIVNNNAIPNEQNDAAISAASGSIVDALKQQLSSGNIGNLVNTFRGGNAEGSAVAHEAASGFSDKLAAMGINMDTAKSIAASIIPSIVGKLVNKTNDPNDNSFNIQDLMARVSGPDGKFDLSDVTGMFTGKTDENGDGKDEGLMDKLKGLF